MTERASDPTNDAPERPRPPVGQRRLLALYEMIRRLNSESDPHKLLESTLDMALEVVRGERGMILLTEPDGSSTVRVVRKLEPETADDAEAFSRGIVQRAGRGQAVLAVDARSDDRFRDLRSVSLYDIHSVMCVPLRSRGTIAGVVYVDRRTPGQTFSPDDLRFLEAFADHAALTLENARARARLERENRDLQAAAEERVRFGNLVGESPAMRRVFELVETYAASPLPVLILGESGTGKELVARAIHFHGPRREAPFLSENCAALPDALLQSELFGHVRGAFTGAQRDRRGLFEQAHEGTLFLDEIGDTSAAMQAQLLRVLEDGQVRRVGDERSRRVDVRVVVATNRDLRQRVAEGVFREDLLYRLQVLVIRMPALRERGDDVERLIRFFLQRSARQRGVAVPSLEPAALEVLLRYRWPGNVRQLENVLQRLSLLAREGRIGLTELARDPALRELVERPRTRETAPTPLARSERERIREALDRAGGNRTRAARLLGISRATIYRKMRQHGL